MPGRRDHLPDGKFGYLGIGTDPVGISRMNGRVLGLGSGALDGQEPAILMIS